MLVQVTFGCASDVELGRRVLLANEPTLTITKGRKA